MSIRSALIGVGVAVHAASVFAQAPASPGPSFEVASVKPNRNIAQEGGILPLPTQFTATNASLRNLLTMAYGMPWFLMVGSQPVLDEHFDIVAKVPAGAGPNPDLRAMLQGLLAERFALRVHNESREQPIYALATNGKLGPKLRVSPVDCLAQIRETGQATPPCSLPRMSSGHYVAAGIPLEVLTNMLSAQSGRVVVDHTGLTGFYDVDLTWDPNAGTNRSQNGDVPSIFTAIQEQMGLRLESTRGWVEVLVIDHVERPTEN